MLIALGLAAFSGLVALVAPVQGVWRFAAMSVVGAVAAGIMMSMAKWTEEPETRAGGLLGMSVCVLLFLGACGLIWEVIIGSQLSELVGVGMVSLACTGFPAAHFLKRIESPGWRSSAFVGTAGAAITFLIAMAGGVSHFLGVSWVDYVRFYATASAFGGAVLCVALALVGWRQAKAPGSGTSDADIWRWLVIPGAMVGVGTAVWGIWSGTGDNPWIPVAGYTLAAVVAHAVLISRTAAAQKFPWLRLATIAAAALTGGLLVTAVWMSLGNYDTIWRMQTGAGILTISGTLALIVIDRLLLRRPFELRRVAVPAVSPAVSSPAGAAPPTTRSGPSAAPVASSVKLECPRCSLSQSIAVGASGALCSQCKLHIAVIVREARCGECGYELRDLKGTTCPECGKSIC